VNLKSNVKTLGSPQNITTALKKNKQLSSVEMEPNNDTDENVETTSQQDILQFLPDEVIAYISSRYCFFTFLSIFLALSQNCFVFVFKKQFKKLAIECHGFDVEISVTNSFNNLSQNTSNCFHVQTETT
jgi:hypothetical protein